MCRVDRVHHAEEAATVKHEGPGHCICSQEAEMNAGSSYSPSNLVWDDAMYIQGKFPSLS